MTNSQLQDRQGKWKKIEGMATKNPLSKKVGIAQPKMPTPMPQIVMKTPGSVQRRDQASDGGDSGGGDSGMIRRRSVLPHDPATQQALQNHVQHGV